jgi:hypothetical protein
MKTKKHLFTVACALALVTSANAGFVNGGFESGDFTGWTLERGLNYGGNGSISFSPGAGGHAYIVGPGTVNDPYSPFDSAFNDSYMARLNEYVPPGSAGLRNATRISQTGIMALNETEIYINWGAVLEDPNHLAAEQPFFLIEVYKNGSLFGSTYKIADPGVGWTLFGSGPDGSQTYYSSGQYHLAGLAMGDSVMVQMTVADCSLSGHAGWAYLDGIGVDAVPPPPGVPDGGSTVALLGLAVSAVGVVRRKLKQS